MTDVANARAKRLLEILDLEKIEQNLYLGSNETSTPLRLFGGQVLSRQPWQPIAPLKGCIYILCTVTSFAPVAPSDRYCTRLNASAMGAVSPPGV